MDQRQAQREKEQEEKKTPRQKTEALYLTDAQQSDQHCSN
jgi:hypothetical protein